MAKKESTLLQESVLAQAKEIEQLKQELDQLRIINSNWQKDFSEQKLLYNKLQQINDEKNKVLAGIEKLLKTV